MSKSITTIKRLYEQPNSWFKANEPVMRFGQLGSSYNLF